jgi:hypothetical protein
MAFKAYLESLEGLEEGQDTLYKARDGGGFVLDVEDVQLEDGKAFGLADYGGLKKALGSERASAAESKAALKAFDGVDLEALNAAAEFQSKYKGKTDDDFESKLAELQLGFEEKLKVNSDKMNEALSAKDNAMKGSIVERVIAKHKDKIMGSEVLEGILRNHLTERMGLDDNGSHYITDDNGNPQQSGRSDSLGNMDVEEYFGAMQENTAKWGAFFKPNDNSGSGGTDIKAVNTGKMTKDEYSTATPDARQTFYMANQSYCDSNGYND